MERAKYLALTLVVLASACGCKPSGEPTGGTPEAEGARAPGVQGEMREDGGARELAGERTSMGVFVRGRRPDALAFARDAWALGGLVPEERVGVFYSDPRPPDGDGSRLAYLSFSIGDEDPGGFARRLGESWDRIPRPSGGEGTPATVRELNQDDPPYDQKRDLRLYGMALSNVLSAPGEARDAFGTPPSIWRVGMDIYPARVGEKRQDAYINPENGEGLLLRVDDYLD